MLERVKQYIRDEEDPVFRSEVEKLLAENNEAELKERFWQDLEFGTGGLRGIIGGGFNRMNSLVVRRATQGMCDYLLDTVKGKSLSACIAYDSRRYSAQFAMDTALIFAANGIKAWLFSSPRPTPELSFAIRHLKADTGVVITASHNPPQYNGYKAYWSDGAQVIPPHDKGIIERVNAVKVIKTMKQDVAQAEGLLRIIDCAVDDPYREMVKAQLFRPELFKTAGDVKIVYTPLHGTGAFHMEAIMADLGLDMHTVPEQREPDGEFPTVAYPNPEEAAALDMAIKLGKKINADVVMATDPDADRLGIAVPDGKGDFALISGNQLGALHLDYILLSRTELGKMPARPAAIKSIVTSGLQTIITQSYGAEMHECLTGFKWIAAVMSRFEKEGRGFVYGSEESYGYLVENEVRDKDGISAAAITAEMTLYWRQKGKSLLDRLDELFVEHGYHEEKGISRQFEGADGMAKMQAIMADYRKNQPLSMGGIKVKRIRDIKTGLAWNTESPKKTEQVDIPQSDVIQWYLEDGTLVTVRPSGTEPKIKYYIHAKSAQKDLDKARADCKNKITAISSDIETRLKS